MQVKSEKKIVFSTLVNGGIYVLSDPQKQETESGIFISDEDRKDKGIGTVVLVSEDMPNCKIKVGDRIMYRTVSTLILLDDPNERHVIVEYRDVIGKVE